MKQRKPSVEQRKKPKNKKLISIVCLTNTNTRIMYIQNELRKWADKTAKGYVSIAKEIGIDAPSFYTQSDLTKIVTSPEVVVLGINPGSGGTYLSQKENPNWGLCGKDMDGEHLIQGNFCKNKFGNPNWSDRNKWQYWNRLKAYFGGVKSGNPLENEKDFVITNMSFFNSKEAKQLPNELLIKSIPYSLDLIRILVPRHLLFLGGEGMLNKLKRANRNNKLFEMSYEMIKPRVYKGRFNGVPFLAVPHPSARLKREERQTIIDIITDFMSN